MIRLLCTALRNTNDCWRRVTTTRGARCTAVELALDSEGVSKQHILNVLARLLEPALPAPLDTPAHLQLTDEPVADVNRYDRLREGVHAS